MTSPVWTILLIFYLVGAHARNLVIQTTEGDISGTTRTTRNGREVLAFLGVPYAEPPIGNLRFHKPLLKRPWNGTLNATEYGAECPQIGNNNVFSTHEDCLFLNVFTPRIPLRKEALLPVMVFIHGGAFVLGNTSTDLSGAEYILDKDVVLVTFNYRLGIFGFLSTGDKEAPGNFGLKDQVLVLEWVQRNIRSFGGDPTQVTLFGQSAGSVSINLHALSDKTKGLFRRFITESGGALVPWAFKHNSTYSVYATKVGELYNCPTHSTSALVACLRQLSVSQLLDTNSVFDPIVALSKLTWAPTNEPDSEDAFLTDSPANLIKQGKMKDLPFISGHVKNEGLVVTTLFYADDQLYQALALFLPIILQQVLAAYVHPDNAADLAKEVMRFYFNGKVDKDKDVVLQQLTDFVTDVFFIYPEVVKIDYLSQTAKSPFYFYSFEYRGSFSTTYVTLRNNTDIGVTHGDETIYLFPLTASAFGLPDVPQTEADKKMINSMVDLWTSFAINGAPVSDHFENPYIWNRYSDDTSHLRIGNSSDPNPALQHSFLESRMAFWRKYNPNILK